MRASLSAPRAAALAVALAIAACAPRASSTDTLGESVRSFNDGVRWERFASAAVRVPPPERSQFVEDMDERATDLKITDYEIVRVDPRGPREARVQIKLSWYLTSEGTLRETHAMQTWERRGDAWLMVAEARVRGAEMPGLPEPALAEPAGSEPAASVDPRVVPSVDPSIDPREERVGAGEVAAP